MLIDSYQVNEACDYLTICHRNLSKILRGAGGGGGGRGLQVLTAAYDNIRLTVLKSNSFYTNQNPSFALVRRLFYKFGINPLHAFEYRAWKR